MAHSTVKEVSRYTFSSTDHLFLDANIWLYLYGPQQPPASSYVKNLNSELKSTLTSW